ncbi:MAG: PPC domain-containing protein [Planctomycetota bacterium]
MNRRVLAVTLALLASAGTAQDFTLSRPRGAAPGDALTLRVYGKGLSDLCGVIVFEPGLEFGAIKTERDDRATVELKVAPDCRLGHHLIALRTLRGITRAKVFAIGPLHGESETRGPHADAATAQPIALDSTIEGRVLGEESDWYAVDVPAGTHLQVEVEGQRLADTDWDPMVEVRAPDGSLVREADDSALGRLDPITTVDCAAAGKWFVVVRDVAARGSSLAAYRLHVGTWSRPLGALPDALAAGAEARVKLLGDGEPREATVTAPSHDGVFEWFPRLGDRVPPTSIPMLADPRPVFVEGALPAEPPSTGCAFHGVIAAEGEEDRFPLRVKKGERVEINVLAQAMRSPLDPVLIVRDESGNEKVSNDDGRGLDARLRFTAQSDATIQLCVRDQLRRGGADFVYRIETGSVARGPSTSESVPGRRAEDFGVSVPQGGRNATLLAVDGLDAKDGIAIGLRELPGGVSVAPVTMVDGIATVPIVVEAAGDAAPAASLSQPTARAERGDAERAVVHRHEFPLLRVRNNEAVVDGRIDGLPIAVVEACPFAIEVVEPHLPLVRNGSAALTMQVARQEGFKSTLSVRPLWMPPGLSIATVSVRDGQPSVSVAIGARSNAMLGRFPLVLVATADDRGVVRSVSSRVFFVEVQEPWVEASLSRAKIEQGGESTLRIDVKRRADFDGEVVAELGRLPTGVEASFPQIPHDGGAIDVQLRAKPDAQVGRNRSVYVKLKVITKDGEVAQAFGGGEIRVDRPITRRARNSGGGGQ